MKKVLCVFLFTTLLLMFSACGTASNGSENAVANVYRNTAQSFVEQGDYASAIKVLEEGISSTQDEELEKMFQDLLASTQSDVQQNGSGYAGTWASEEAYWLNGGLILDISERGQNMVIDVTYTQAAPESKVASFAVEAALSEVKDGTVSLEFVDDGWGNAGTIMLEFLETTINCEIKDTHYVGDEAFALWGISEEYFYMYRNEDAHAMMEYDMEDYYAWEAEYFATWGEDIEETPAYDTSTASGILASLGMTEEEFRNNCRRLFSSSVQIGKTDESALYYFDLVEYPSNYLNSYFVIDNLSGYDFNCSYKGLSDDGYPYYEDCDAYDYNAVIYDFRDDVYSPNIVKGDDFTPYVIFREVRTINGDEWLVFWMITMDKK